MRELDLGYSSAADPVSAEAASPSEQSRNELRIVGITSVGHALCHIAELVFAAVIVALMREFRLAPDEATRLAVPGFLLFGIGAVPAGLWTDRRGSREVLTVYFFLLAAAAAAVALVSSQMQLVVALTLLGAAISLYHPAGLAMISHGCRNRGRAMGINGIAGSIGIATGPFLGLWMVASGNWRMAYWVIAVASVLAGVVSLLVRVDDGVPVHDPTASGSRLGGGVRVPWRALCVLYAAMLVGGLNYRCMTTVLPSLLSGQGEANTTAAAAATNGRPEQPAEATVTPALDRRAALVFLVLAVGGVGQLLGGFAADKIRPAMTYTVLILLTVPMALLMAHGSSTTTAVAAMGLCLFVFAQQPVENTMVAQATPARWRSTGYGLKFILTFGVGALGAQLAGVIWQRAGLSSVFDLFAAGASLMAVIATVYWMSQRPKQRGDTVNPDPGG